MSAEGYYLVHTQEQLSTVCYTQPMPDEDSRSTDLKAWDNAAMSWKREYVSDVDTTSLMHQLWLLLADVLHDPCI